MEAMPLAEYERSLKMLILLISLIILVIGIILWSKGSWYNDLDIWGYILIITSGVVLIIELAVLIVLASVQFPNEKIEYENIYDNLTHQLMIYESKDEIDYESVAWKNLYDDITKYNTHITIQVRMSRNIWVGWFYNYKLRDLELIEIKK